MQTVRWNNSGKNFFPNRNILAQFLKKGGPSSFGDSVYKWYKHKYTYVYMRNIFHNVYNLYTLCDLNLQIL